MSTIDSIRLVLRVNPGDVSNNRRHVPEYDRRRRPTGRLILSREYRSGLDEMALQVASQRHAEGWTTVRKPSFVTVSIVTYWPTWQGDVDATSKASIDALQLGGIVENDRQCLPVTLSRAVDKDSPRIEIEVVRG